MQVSWWSFDLIQKSWKCFFDNVRIILYDKGYRLYVITMSRTRFGMNLRSIAVWMSRNSLLKTGVIFEVLSDSNGIRTHNDLVRKQHSTI